MIPVDRVDKPPCFDRDARDPGNAWLEANPNAKSGQFPDYWSQFRRELAEGFNYLCGYSAMFAKPGTVDHYICKSSRHGRSLTYEWSNYRFASHRLNELKGTWNARILDPFEIGQGWFEVLLPHLEMVLVEERIPPEHRADAQFTLEKLRLYDDDDILEIRRDWYEQFTDGDLTLSRLKQYAPLIACAVEKRLSEIPRAAIEDARTWFDGFVDGTYNFKTVRRHAPNLAEEIERLLARSDPRSLRRS